MTEEKEHGTLVLVVDDSATLREYLRLVLKAWGYQVLTARDGAQALALAREQRFSHVITDLQMLGMDGLELTRALRASSNTSALKIMLNTSGPISEDLVRQAQDAGGDAVSSKSEGIERWHQVMAAFLTGS